MEDSRAMDDTTNMKLERPIWIEIAITVIRTAIGLVFIFWLLSLVPAQSDPRISIPATLLLIGMVIYGLVLRWQLKRVVKSQSPGLVATESLILSAGLFIAIFSAIYVIIEGDSPGSFTEPLDHFTAVYFTITVLSTVGFGDITAVTDTARSIVMAQMILGLGFIAIIIKVFTSTAQKAKAARKAKPDPETPDKEET